MTQVIILVVAALLAVVLIWLVRTYNRLVTLRNKTEEGWSGVDVQLQRRADLIPNLVEVVKGYAAHESDTFEAVTQARGAVNAARTPQEASQADKQMQGAVKRLLAVAEAYPDLRAGTNFLKLQHQLGEIEEELAFARRYYNATVKELNTLVQTFPTVVVAGPFGFREAEYFRADEESRTVPAVEFGS